MNIRIYNMRSFLLVLPLVCQAAAYGQAPPEEAAEIPAVETNPAVRAALEMPREEPADYFQAIVWLIDLGRPELAKPILEDLSKLPLDDAQRAALVTRFGSRDMLRLARANELAPAGAAFADAAMAAAAATASDSQRIATLVAQLNAPSAEARAMARSDLAAIGEPAAIALLEALVTASDAEARALQDALYSLEPFAAGPLIAMLATNDRTFRARVSELLVAMRVPQAMPLVASATGAQAEPLLVAALERAEQGTPPWTPDEQSRIELWHWNDAQKKLSATQHPVDEARIIWAARLADELAQLRPTYRAYQRKALVLGLEAASFAPGAASKAPLDRLRMVDLEMVDDALADALAADYARAAVAAINALAARGDSRVLYRADAQPSALANALGHASRRVRFAALRAIMALNPASPYSGSSRVPDALAWFATGTGARRALVAMPTLYAASDLAGMLAAHELDAQATNRGRDVVDWARGTADLEMILADMNVLEPGIRQVVYELRLIPETRQVPIALLAAEGRLRDAERLAAEHDGVVAVPRPHSAEVLARVVERLSSAAGRDPMTPDERAAQAALAKEWLDELATRRPFYTIRRVSELPLETTGLPAVFPGHVEREKGTASPSRGHGTPAGARPAAPAAQPADTGSQ